MENKSEPQPPSPAKWTRQSVSPEGLPPRRQQRFLDYTNPETGRHLTGEFLFERLSIARIGQVETRRATLNGGNPPSSMSDEGYTINTMLASFDFSIVKAPDWWKPYEEDDLLLLRAVYDEVVAFESSFRKAAQSRVQPPATNGSAEREAGMAAKVVGAEVPAPSNK